MLWSNYWWSGIILHVFDTTRFKLQIYILAMLWLAPRLIWWFEKICKLNMIFIANLYKATSTIITNLWKKIHPGNRLSKLYVNDNILLVSLHTCMSKYKKWQPWVVCYVGLLRHKFPGINLFYLHNKIGLFEIHSVQYKNRSAFGGAQFLPMGIPTIGRNTCKNEHKYCIANKFIL